MYRLRVVSYADGTSISLIAMWIGDGPDQLTSLPNYAKTFATQEEARAYWAKPDKRRPRRDDGKPNRPLAMFTCLVEPVPDYVPEEVS